MLGLEVDDLLGGEWSPQIMSCGLPFLFVPLHDRAAVARARIRMDAWEATLGGAPVAVACELAEAAAEEDEAPLVAAGPPAIGEEELVERLKGEFGAREVFDDPEES